MKRLLKLLLLSLIFTLNICCGVDEGPLKRDYTYNISTSDSAIQETIIKALEEYNKQAGIQMVGYTTDNPNSRSTISVTPGKDLKHPITGENKIGLARYIINRGTTYGEIQFDHNYLKERSDLSQGLNKEAFLLVTHEVGHVLGLQHVEEQTDVMNPVINNAEKNIPLHFLKAVHSYNQPRPTNVI